MVNNPLAVLPGMQNDVTRLITILLLASLQTLVLFADITTLKKIREPERYANRTRI